MDIACLQFRCKTKKRVASTAACRLMQGAAIPAHSVWGGLRWYSSALTKEPWLRRESLAYDSAAKPKSVWRPRRHAA